MKSIRMTLFFILHYYYYFLSFLTATTTLQILLFPQLCHHQSSNLYIISPQKTHQKGTKAPQPTIKNPLFFCLFLFLFFLLLACSLFFFFLFFITPLEDFCAFFVTPGKTPKNKARKLGFFGSGELDSKN